MNSPKLPAISSLMRIWTDQSVTQFKYCYRIFPAHPRAGRRQEILDPSFQKTGHRGADSVSRQIIEQFAELGILVNDPRVSGDLHHRDLRFQRILIRS